MLMKILQGSEDLASRRTLAWGAERLGICSKSRDSGVARVLLAWARTQLDSERERVR